MLRLTAERQQRGWSQAEVARRTGLHPTTISHLESQDIKPWPSYRKRLARLFGVPPDQLFAERKAEMGGSNHDIKKDPPRL